MSGADLQAAYDALGSAEARAAFRARHARVRYVVCRAEDLDAQLLALGEGPRPVRAFVKETFAVPVCLVECSEWVTDATGPGSSALDTGGPLGPASPGRCMGSDGAVHHPPSGGSSSDTLSSRAAERDPATGSGSLCPRGSGSGGSLSGSLEDSIRDLQEGKVLLLSGCPPMGKTALAMGIAEALCQGESEAVEAAGSGGGVMSAELVSSAAVSPGAHPVEGGGGLGVGAKEAKNGGGAKRGQLGWTEPSREFCRELDTFAVVLKHLANCADRERKAGMPGGTGDKEVKELGRAVVCRIVFIECHGVDRIIDLDEDSCRATYNASIVILNGVAHKNNHGPVGWRAFVEREKSEAVEAATAEVGS